MDMFFLIMILTLLMLIVDYFDQPKNIEDIVPPQIIVVNDNLAVGDFVIFEVFSIKKSEFNQTNQTIRGEVLSFGEERIEIDNFDRKNDPKARKDSQGRARRQYRFDQILGGRKQIRIAYHG